MTVTGSLLWINVTKWTVGTAIASGAVVAALGGPEDAWLKTQAAIWGHPPPRIISVELDSGAPKGTYIVALRNPALEPVAVTGYRADVANLGISDGDPINASNASTATPADGAVTVMGAEEQDPEPCEFQRYVSLPRPLVIEPRSVRAIQVRPWRESCVFSITVLSDHGETKRSLNVSGFDE